MDSETFRKRASYAVETVAKFIEEFPELYCVVRIGDKTGGMDVMVGVTDSDTSDEEEE